MASKSKKITLFLGFLIFLVVASIGGYEITSQPAFCNNCHSMKTQYATWQTSSHKSVDCYSCHIEPGLKGHLSAKLNGLNQLYETVSGNVPETIEANVPDERCLACHKQIPDPKVKTVSKKLKDKEITFDHNLHKNKFNCTECHARVVHNNQKLTDNDVKVTCINCHIEQNAVVKDCKACHKPFHKTNYLENHSEAKSKLAECISCHANAKWSTGLSGVGSGFCKKCHTNL